MYFEIPRWAGRFFSSEMGWVGGTEQMNGWDPRYVGEVNYFDNVREEIFHRPFIHIFGT